MVNKERIITNKLLIDDLDFWDQVMIKVNDDDNVKKFYADISKIIDEQINESIEWLDSEEAKSFFFEQSEYQQDLFEDLDDALDEILDKDFISIDALLDEVYRKGKEIGYDDIDSRIRFTEADRLALQIAKDYNYMLVNNLSDDLRHKVRYEMFKGLIAGENPYIMANRLVKVGVQPLEGSTFTPKQRATLIARTETSRIQNTGILQSYVNEGYQHVKLLTAEDNNVCTICLQYAYEYNKDSEISYENRGEEKKHLIKDIMGLIPFHPVCRCTVLSVWESKGDPPDEPFVTNLTENQNSLTLIEGKDGRFYPIVGDTYAGRINFERKYGITADDLTPEELDFIRMYTKYADSILNYELRELKNDPNVPKMNPKKEWNKLAKERGVDISFERALELSKSVFKKGKILNEPIVIVRRERTRHMKVEDGESTYSDKGILSTAIGKNIKEKIYGNQINYIIIPEGKRILYVEGITATNEDYEIILPPDSVFIPIRDMSDHEKVWELE